MYRNSLYCSYNFSVSLKFYQNKTLKENRRGTLGPRGWRNTAVRSTPAKEILVSCSSNVPRKHTGLISEGGEKQGCMFG